MRCTSASGSCPLIGCSSRPSTMRATAYRWRRWCCRSGTPLGQYGHNSAKALHVMIEAKKLAYADLLQYVGDPRFTHVPVEQLLSKELARKRADFIDPNKAHCTVLPSELSEKMNAMGRETT